MDTSAEGMVVGKRRWIEKLCLLEVAAEVALIQSDQIESAIVGYAATVRPAEYDEQAQP